MKSRSALAVALFLFLSFTAAAAEVVTVVDTDHNAATGCIVRGYSGIDAVATTRVDNTPSGVIVSFVRLQRCVAGSLGPAIELPAGWRVPSDGAVQHVESAIPYAALGIDRTTPARYAFVLVQDPALPLVIPADGSMLTFNAETRRRSAAPAYEGTLPKADGLLDDWKSFQNRASAGRVDVWMQAGIDALVLRFDIRSAGGPQATDDDYVVPVAGTLNIGAPGVLANDSDPDGDPLTAQLVTPASHGIVSLETDGSFVYQHDGTSAPFDSFTYRASDGLTTSDAATVSITPVVVNERPVGSDDHYSTTEDQVLNVAAPGVLANDSDPDGDPLTATLLSGPASGTLNLQSDGSFTYTPAANFNGSVTFLYTVSDGSLVSEPVVVTIDITAVNDAPSFNAGGDVTVLEDSGAYSAAWASAISAGPAETQTLSFEITNNSNPSLFSVLPALSATGVLTFTPAADANGSATITVRLHDDGGTANGGVDTSATTTFTINFNAVNDPPSFVLPANAPAVDEDSGAQTVNNFTTSISAGPADESAQTLTFGVTQTSASSTLTFAVAPAIAADGTLTYTPAANAFGTATFNVVLTDSGTGTNTTAAQSFTITVNAINDAPSFAIASNPPVSNEDGGAQTVNNFTTSISQGPNESGQALTFSLTPTGTTGTLTFASAPVIAADGTLTYTASANTAGTATFLVVLTDSG
ncbi:MAG: tandem-95 repeat protein, partial [Thermoanaerobaculia bacterium]